MKQSYTFMYNIMFFYFEFANFIFLYKLLHQKIERKRKNRIKEELLYSSILSIFFCCCRSEWMKKSSFIHPDLCKYAAVPSFVYFLFKFLQMLSIIYAIFFPMTITLHPRKFYVFLFSDVFIILFDLAVYRIEFFSI